MKIPIIKIGNSRGIVLSKTMMERYGFKEEIEVQMKPDSLELKPLTSPRQGWDTAFQQMFEQSDDVLLDNDILDDDIIEEWK